MVLASLYGRVRSGQKLSVGIPDTGARALSAVIEAKKPIVGISFGNPYLLTELSRTANLHRGVWRYAESATGRCARADGEIVVESFRSLCRGCIRGTGIQVKVK